MKPTHSPTAVYAPEPLTLAPGQALSPAQGFSQPIVVIQQQPTEQNWLKAHGGQLVAAGGAGVLVVAVLLALAIVAVAVGIGAISCALGWVVLKSVINEQPTSKK